MVGHDQRHGVELGGVGVDANVVHHRIGLQFRLDLAQ